MNWKSSAARKILHYTVTVNARHPSKVPLRSFGGRAAISSRAFCWISSGTGGGVGQVLANWAYIFVSYVLYVVSFTIITSVGVRTFWTVAHSWDSTARLLRDFLVGFESIKGLNIII